MPIVRVNFGGVEPQITGGYDTDGSVIDMQECVVVPVHIPADQADLWLAAYDSNNQYSPTAADSRVIARAVLGALKKAVEDA